MRTLPHLFPAFALLVGVLSGVGCDGSRPNPSTETDTGASLPDPGIWEGGDRIVQLVASSATACALYDAGGVQCWGTNAYGVRGADPDLFQEERAYAHPYLGGGVDQLTAGRDHFCALRSGEVLCWGRNFSGQLDGTVYASEIDRANPIPVPVSALDPGVSDIEAGGSHSCAIQADGGVVCWGSNLNGEMGIGVIADPFVDDGEKVPPVRVQGLERPASQLAGRASGMCALLDDESVRCWGGNWAYLDFAAFPIAAPGLLEGVTDIFGSADGEQVCAIQDGATRCLGFNSVGELGIGNTDFQPYAELLLDADIGSAIVEAGGGEDFSCVLAEGGGVWCMGRSANGRLGNGAAANTQPFPGAVDLPGAAKHLAVGTAFACAALEDDRVFCWGDGPALGDSPSGRTEADSDTPVEVQGLTDFASPPGWEDNPPAAERFPHALAPAPDPDPFAWAGGDRPVALRAGGNSACALYDGGGVRCWGTTDTTLGSLPASPAMPATMLPTLGQGVIAIGPGDGSSCALYTDDTVRCWGETLNDQLGQPVTGGPVAEPRQIPALGSGFSDLVMGQNRGCVVRDSGTLRCWGANSTGQLGLGTTSNSEPPTDVDPGGVVEQLHLQSNRMSCALLDTGSVLCWGEENLSPQGPVRLPTEVPGLESGVTDIALGWGGHFCAVQDATLKCFGRNDSGQLGFSGTSTGTLTPVSLTGTPELVAAGDDFTCVSFVEGGVACAGRDVLPGSGNPNFTPIDGIDEEIVALEAGLTHACALLQTGALKCWGNGTDGQLGTLGFEAVYTAVNVVTP